MSDVDAVGRWNSFWFSPVAATRLAAADRVASIRGLLCILTVAYFVSSWSDAAFWYVGDGPLSPARVSTFLQAGDVQDAARWIISPLFLVDSIWIFRGYLIVGVFIAMMVALGRGGQFACWLLWLLLIGWANRAMILSGLTETLLSLGLFATAIAPPRTSLKSLRKRSGAVDQVDWRFGFSERLLAAQITVIGAATFLTMLGGRVWFNGLGAYALAAPAENRSIDWTNSLLVQPLVHESLTHLMVIALPLGLVLAWLANTSRVGKAILIGWCLAVAMLGSQWIYACAFGAMVCSIRPSN